MWAGNSGMGEEPQPRAGPTSWNSHPKPPQCFQKQLKLTGTSEQVQRVQILSWVCFFLSRNYRISMLEYLEDLTNSLNV